MPKFYAENKEEIIKQGLSKSGHTASIIGGSVLANEIIRSRNGPQVIQHQENQSGLVNLHANGNGSSFWLLFLAISMGVGLILGIALILFYIKKKFCGSLLCSKKKPRDNYPGLSPDLIEFIHGNNMKQWQKNFILREKRLSQF